MQNDLNSLHEWAHTWQLKFNVEKCETMRLTHSNDTLKSSYTLGTSILKDTESFKDLGVAVLHDLTWSKHVCITVNKANKILGTIKRSVGTTNSVLYNALVRPILEYAAPVWRDYLSLLECYKIVFGLYQLNFSDFFEWSRVKSTRANHAYKLCVKASRVNCYKYSFFCKDYRLVERVAKIRSRG